MATSPDVMDDLRNAAAQNRLLIVSGAGISCALKRPDGTKLPDWGQLVQALQSSADLSRIDSEAQGLLDELLPAGALSEVHGDALIEASEILQHGFPPTEFEKAIADICREADGELSDTHRAIAEIGPVGVVTFNYDGAHERAFAEVGIAALPILYHEDAKLKSLLSRRRDSGPFVLKAHGCVSDPPSLVLTSSSYRRVLSDNRAYRLFLQHALIHYTVLIVGFGLRDRDFDQLLQTLEIELGKPIQRHAFLAVAPDTSPAGQVKRAGWAAISARFGVQSIYVGDYSEIPGLIRSIASQPGSLVHNLVNRSVSSDKAERTRAHEEIELLGTIGRRQIKARLLDLLENGRPDFATRSELIYVLGTIAKDDPEAARLLLDEVRPAASAAAATLDPQQVECAAHALLMLGRFRLPDRAEREPVLNALEEEGMIDALTRIDSWLAATGGVPRLVVYARAAGAQIEARSRA